MTETLQAIDLALLHVMRPWETPWLDLSMRWLSTSGAAAGVWLILAGVAFLRRRDRASAWRILLTVALAYAAVDGIFKPLFQRERPSVLATAPPRDLPPLPRTSSFPSGHAASTFGAVVGVSRMWPQTRVVWWTLAVLIGYSRIYLAHHYPFDVVGGALLGILIALWVHGGRHRATYARTLPRALPPGVVIGP